MKATRQLHLLPFGPLVAGVAAMAAAVGVVAANSPMVALLVVLGGAFVVLVVADLTVGLFLFVGLSYLETFPALAKATGLLLVASWVATVAMRKRGEPSLVTAQPALVVLLTLFVVWVAASALWARESEPVLTELTRFLPLFVLFAIVHLAVRTRSHMTILVLVVIAGAIVSVALGMVFPPPPDSQGAGRLSGAGTGANALAPVLVAGAVLAAAFAGMTTRAAVVRLAAVGLIAFFIVGVILTGSRGGLIGLVVALLVGVAFAGRGRRARIMPLLVVGIALTVLYVVALAPPQLRDRLAEPGDGSGRTDIWRVALEMVKDNPVLGVGAGNFKARSPEYVLQAGLIRRSDLIVDNPHVTHNIYLQVLSQLGIVGLLLFLAVVGTALAAAVMAAQAFARQKAEELELLARALVIALCGMLAAGFFGSWLFSKPLWIMLAMCPAMLALARQKPAQPAPASVYPPERAMSAPLIH